MSALDEAVGVDTGGDIVFVCLVVLRHRYKEYVLAERLGPLGFFSTQCPQPAGVEQQLALADVVIPRGPAVVADTQSDIVRLPQPVHPVLVIFNGFVPQVVHQLAVFQSDIGNTGGGGQTGFEIPAVDAVAFVRGVYEFREHILESVPVPLALFEQFCGIVQTVFVHSLAVIDNSTLVAGNFYNCHVVLVVPDHGIIGSLYVFPQVGVQINVIIIGDKHAADSTLGECVPVAAVEKVDALIAVNGVGEVVVPCTIGGLVELDLSAVAFLKHCQFDGRGLSGIVGVDVPV